MFTISINGTDISNLIAFKGLKWSRNDVDGANSGRSLNGNMIRDFVTTKDKLEITCRPLTSAELSALLTLVEPTQNNQGQMSVTYPSPRGTNVTKTMYMSNVPASYLINKGATGLWGGVTIHLIEV